MFLLIQDWKAKLQQINKVLYIQKLVDQEVSKNSIVNKYKLKKMLLYND